MNSIAEAIANGVLNAVWQIPLLAVAGALICRWLRRLGPEAEHRVWVGVLALSVLLPTEGGLRLLLGAGAHRAASPAVAVSVQAAPAAALHRAWTLTAPATLLRTVTVLYLLFTLFALLRFAASLFSARRLVRRSEPLLLPAGALEIFGEVEREFGLKDVRLRGSQDIAGPVTLSLRHHALLLPRGFAESTALEDLRAAFAHECAHIQRRDFVKNTVYGAASLLVAFHPATGWIRAQIAQTREMRCDQLAVGVVREPRSYAQSLLRLASAIGASTPAAHHGAIGIFDANGNVRSLETRIMTIRAKQIVPSAAMRRGMVAVSAVVLLLTAGASATAALRVASATPGYQAAGAQTAPMYSVGHDGVSAPVLIKQVDPEYPASESEHKTNFIGSCTVGLIVDAAGVPQDLKIVQSLGPDFDESALTAIRQYRFKPAQRAGVPVPVALFIEVNFQNFEKKKS